MKLFILISIKTIQFECGASVLIVWPTRSILLQTFVGISHFAAFSDNCARVDFYV